MKTFAIYHRSPTPDGVLADPDASVFIKEGPAWPALFIPFLWALWQRMWLVAACLFALELCVAGASELMSLPPISTFVISILINFLIALEANELRRWTLERRGYGLVDLVTAPSAYEAELIYFERLLASHTVRKPERNALKTRLKLPATAEDNSLFPATGA